MKKLENSNSTLEHLLIDAVDTRNSLKSLNSLLVSSSVSLYEKSPAFNFNGTPLYSAAEKKSNEDGIRRIITSLQKELKPWQTSIISTLSQDDGEALEKIITAHLIKLDQGRYLFDEPFLEFFLEKGYLKSAQDFFLMAKEKDGNLTLEEVFQAMRNVWIMNSLQLIWDLPLEITPSVYAYSMLYPYTDNFLDDPEVSDLGKKQFNQKLSDLIQGIPQTSNNFHQKRVFQLISEIENQYPRDRFPMVYEGLGLIQDAQILSLSQDQSETLTKENLLELSFYKGGSSVLGDACLVKGALNPQEITFTFNYGTFLQLIDDLQDVEEDCANGHQTLFNTRPVHHFLDDHVLALISYLTTITKPNDSDSAMTQYMMRIIGSCTRLMVMSSLGKTPNLISKPLYQKLEAISKVHLDFYSSIEKEFDFMTSKIKFDQPLKEFFKSFK